MTAAVLVLLLAQKVDPMEVDRAVEKAGKYLIQLAPSAHGSYEYQGTTMRYAELVLLTLLHCGYTESDEAVRGLLKTILETPVERTYLASLQAMCLVKLDPAKHQARLEEIAQFLTDNQCRNGQWSYGQPLQKKDVATPTKEPADTGGSSTKALRRITIKKKGDGPEKGDNSNTQYAALGLRACHDGGIRFPSDTISKAKKWWESAQNDDGGWGYHGKNEGKSYGSMTAGAIASIAILNYITSGGPGGGAAIDKGRKWLADQFTVKENPKHEGWGQYYFYYLYALERTGIFLNTEKFGKADWYFEGATHLLATQKKSGEWGDTIPDLCFAILFLRRASQPLKPVATGGGK